MNSYHDVISISMQIWTTISEIVIEQIIGSRQYSAKIKWAINYR